jgi:hypothetical protein
MDVVARIADQRDTLTVARQVVRPAKVVLAQQEFVGVVGVI